MPVKTKFRPPKLRKRGVRLRGVLRHHGFRLCDLLPLLPFQEKNVKQFYDGTRERIIIIVKELPS